MITHRNSSFYLRSLVALQIFIPNLSFEGHLSGIIAGLLQLYGMLDGIMPSEGSFRQMDDTSNLRCLSSMSSFAVTTNTQYVRFESQWLRRLHNNSSRTLCSCIGFAGDVIAESTVSVFQRVRSLRSSIPVDAASSVDLDEEEEDWCGLPSKLETTRLTTSEII